jgi:predicted nuclease of predicted toxin-antitoxin system
VKLELDENLGTRRREILPQAGHDVATVAEQKLGGAEDGELIEVCRQEERCLVTLDLDFANPLSFPPKNYSGIAVLRHPARATTEHLLTLVKTLVRALESESIVGHLWVVEAGPIRIHQEPNP